MTSELSAHKAFLFRTSMDRIALYANAPSYGWVSANPMGIECGMSVDKQVWGHTIGKGALLGPPCLMLTFRRSTQFLNRFE